MINELRLGDLCDDFYMAINNDPSFRDCWVLCDDLGVVIFKKWYSMDESDLVTLMMTFKRWFLMLFDKIQYFFLYN